MRVCVCGSLGVGLVVIPFHVLGLHMRVWGCVCVRVCRPYCVCGSCWSACVVDKLLCAGVCGDGSL